MKDDLVSVIVPIYNAENTLHKCIMSVQNQTYLKLEIILVDDGSKDSSLKICELFAKTDRRIRIIQQANAGVSAARNKGILVARGVYCCFVDSDDWIEKEHIENMVSAIRGVDCIITGYLKENSNSEIENRLAERVYLLNRLKDWSIIEVFERGFIHPCWNKLFRMEILKQYYIFFPLDIRISEDTLFCIEYFKHCSSIKTIDKLTYHYCFSNINLSLSKMVYDNIFEIYAQVYNCLEELLNHKRCEEKIKREILIRTIYPQFYISVFKILRDDSKSFEEKKCLLDKMLDELNGRQILQMGGKKSSVKKEVIIIKLILAKQYRLVGGLLKWIDKKSRK